MKNVNFKPISGWLWLLYKIADNNCRSRLFTEFIQTQKRYLTLLDKTVFRSSRPQVFLRKVVLKNTQQIYRRTPIPKCDFNKVALQLKNTSGRLLLSILTWRLVVILKHSFSCELNSSRTYYLQNNSYLLLRF